MHKGWNVGLYAIVAIFAMSMGFLLMEEIGTIHRLAVAANVRQGQMLSALVSQAVQKNAQLTQSLNQEQKSLAQTSSSGPSTSQLELALRQAESSAGLLAEKGRGVTVSLEDASAPAYPGEPDEYRLVHDQYVLHIIADLSAAGATAIAINGQRYVSTSAIFCAGPTIRVNGVPYGSPFLIKALGSPGPMLATLNQDPSVQGWSQLVSIHYRAGALEIPAYQQPVSLSLVKPVKIGPVGS